MPKIIVHLYGLVKGDFCSQEFEISSPCTLGDLQKDIVKKYGKDINKEYLDDQGYFNPKLVRVGDASGKRIDDLSTDISSLKEIWFVVPFSGG